MIGYVKSHSNYRIQERHQLVNNGTIFERDISTVGGANTFARGLATVYQSGNFVIVVNNSSSPSRHIRKSSWLASGYNSDMWDNAILSQHSSDVYGSIEKNITPKNDFMDLRSFSYFGSLSSLVENTVSKILTTYPYELFITNKIDELNEGTLVIPSGNCYPVENPGSIDIYNENAQQNLSDDVLGHFYNGGIDNYGLYFDNDNDPISGYDFTWNVETVAIYNCAVDKNANVNVGDEYTVNGNKWHVCGVVVTDNKYVFVECFDVDDAEIDENGSFGGVSYSGATKITGPCKNMFFAKITITTNVNDTESSYVIYAYWDNALKVNYILNTGENDGDISIHIRPRMDLWFYDEFIDNLDLFGKCLMGEFSGIKNTANFEVLSEGDSITQRNIETFVFPTTISHYNLESDGIQMQKYVNGLAKIGVYYDDTYTDNLYRMMTHDSLKNLDWTNTFNGNDGPADNEYLKTGKKFSALVRVMGYVFDQEKAYIDTIGYYNTVTYSGRDNLSDYFLTDSLDTDGWVVNSVYPYDLKEYSASTSGEYVDVTSSGIWSISAQTGNIYSRKFSENTALIISPYFGGPNAYYEHCSGGEPVKEEIQNENYSGQTYVVVDGDVLNVIKDYSEAYQVTLPTINNEFMKRLRINSKQILRKKGTVESIESMLSLFGMRSKRWCGSSSDEYDFDVEEYTIFTPPIEDEFDSQQHRMYKMDWYNSCKTIPYQTQSYLNGEYIEYQGLPVAYRDVDNEGTITRKLYPNFNSNGIYDGDMYYQMNGGWMNYYPYRFDEDDKVFMMLKSNGLEVWPHSAATASYLGKLYIADDKIKLGTCSTIIGPSYSCFISDGFVDNHPAEIVSNIKFKSPKGIYPAGSIIECVRNGSSYAWKIVEWYGNSNYKNYTETLRNVRAVNNMRELVSQPIGDLTDNVIYYVTDTSDRFALINGYPYEIKDIALSGENEMYFEAYVYDGSISVGGELYGGVITVSDPRDEGGITQYNLDLYADGSAIKIFYTGNRVSAFTLSADTVYSDDDMSYALTPETSLLFINGSYEDGVAVSHYFELSSIEGSDKIGSNGWQQIKNDDGKLQVLDSIVDKYYGNNPHLGNYVYDNGKEYISRFEHLFKYAYENRYFDETCFSNVDDVYNEISGYGFTMYTSTDSTNPLIADEKVHAFIDKYTPSPSVIQSYDIDDKSSISQMDDYAFVSGITNADGVSSQIINTKQMKINFYVDDIYGKEGQEYVKYIQCKVMPYVEQVIPSTAIVSVEFMGREEYEAGEQESPGTEPVVNPGGPVVGPGRL